MTIHTTSSRPSRASRTPVRRSASVAISVAVSITAVGCAGEASTSDVCTAYSDLGVAFENSFNAVDNDLFEAIRDAGDAASRYEGDVGVKADGEALKDIGDRDSTDLYTVATATQNISTLCGTGIG